MIHSCSFNEWYINYTALLFVTHSYIVSQEYNKTKYKKKLFIQFIYRIEIYNNAQVTYVTVYADAQLSTELNPFYYYVCIFFILYLFIMDGWCISIKWFTHQTLYWVYSSISLINLHRWLYVICIITAFFICKTKMKKTLLEYKTYLCNSCFS